MTRRDFLRRPILAGLVALFFAGPVRAQVEAVRLEAPIGGAAVPAVGAAVAASASGIPLAGLNALGAAVAPVRPFSPDLRLGAIIPGWPAGPRRPSEAVPSGGVAGSPARAVSLSISPAAPSGIAAVAPAEPGQDVLSQVGAAAADWGRLGVDGGPPGRRAPSAIDATPVDDDKLPQGAKGVHSHYARTPQDVERLIPAEANSYNLILGLKRAVQKYGELRILVYDDAIGGHFVGLDLRSEPAWLDHIPELQPHEKVLIRKILARDSDVQVVVREIGKTPDLIVGGVVTELKSVMGDFPIERLIQKANLQVAEFGRRHMLAGGDVAVDLTRQDSVPVERVAEVLNRWARGARPVLRRVWVYAGRDLKVFSLSPDGTYRLGDPESARRDPAYGGPVDPARLHTLQLLAQRGRLNGAHEALTSLEILHGRQDAPHAPLAQARDMLEAKRALLRIQKLARRPGDKARAFQAWETFRRTHSAETVRLIAPEVLKSLATVRVPETAEIAERASAEGLAREVEEPPQILRRRGIRATVTVYGSARIRPEAEARRAYEADPTPENLKALENSKYYEEARRLGELVALRGGGRLAVVTGGGPGIMEAANRGALEAGGPSVGYNIRLAHEQGLNPYVTPGLSFEFEHFAARKINLRHGAAALVFFPGGFGTMDELFETLTLMQTGKIARVPIVLVGERDYWNQVLDFNHFAERGLVSKEDLSLFRFAESAESAWSVVEEGLGNR